MKKIVCIITTIAMAFICHAQQIHFTSQYIADNFLYNPAAAGMASHGSIGATYRSMWSGIDGGPQTTMLYGDIPLKKLKAGIAGYIYNDVTGPTRRTGVDFAYSYHIVSKNEKNVFGLGLELQALQFYYDMNKLAQYIPNDPLLGGVSTKTLLDAGAGIYYRTDKLHLGASVKQLIQSKLNLATVPNSNESSKLVRHVYVQAAYDFNTGDDIILTPNAIFKYVPHAPAEFNFGTIVNYKDILYWGLNWTVNQSWVIQGGFTLGKKLSFGYAHDIYTTPLSVFDGGGGADEVMLKYNFAK
jgi:type IX secretion system PorP/SprF family membrane protein